VLLPLFAALLTYGGALHGEFVFDDVPTVVDNLSLESIGGFWNAAFGPKHSPISNRPVVCLSFAINYAISGRDSTFSYHLFNLLLHLANVALLWAVLRRGLTAPNLGDRFSEARATWTATAIAAVWAVHPLGTEAVVYITQRTTLMMSFFLLGMLYATLRAATDAEHGFRWRAAAVAACALAMTSKEEAVAAPILLVLFDRAFNYESFSRAFAEQGAFYGSMAATWILLAICVASGPENPTVGYNRQPQVSAFEWLMTEAPVVIRYLTLTVWPSPLIAAYDWPIVRDLSDVFIQGLFVLTLLGATIALWIWKPYWGWLGAWFFLLLAPTTSVLPIVSEVVAERRMYLPMLSLLIPLLLGVGYLIEALARAAGTAPGGRAAWFAVPLTVLVATEWYATSSYAHQFDKEFTLWTDVAAKNKLNNGSFMTSSILSGYAKVLLVKGDYATAIPLLERAKNCRPFLIDAVINLAAAYVDTNRWAEAEKLYQEIASTNPNNPNFYSNYALFLQRAYEVDAPANQKGPADRRLLLGYQLIQKAIQLNPRQSNFYNNLGSISFFLGKVPEADQAWVRALQLDPNNLNALRNRAIVFIQVGRVAEGIQVLEALVKQDPNDVASLINLSRAYFQSGNKAGAIQCAQQVLKVSPGNPVANAILQEISAGK
jgi:tetratricopeptide (TPR) repeat protein